MMQFTMTIANSSFLPMKPLNELARLINKHQACQASLFSDFFSTVFSTTTTDFMEFSCDEVHPDLLMEVFTTRNQVKNILRNLDTSKSTRVDDISARILKECAKEL